jgi:hypothetical protein
LNNAKIYEIGLLKKGKKKIGKILKECPELS